MPVDVRGFVRIIRGLPGAIETGIDRGAGFIADLAQQLAPVDTGELRASIHVEAGALPLSRRVVASAPHAAFVEFGTRFMEAQPYLTPARQQIRVLDEVAIEVRKLVQG